MAEKPRIVLVQYPGRISSVWGLHGAKNPVRSGDLDYSTIVILIPNSTSTVVTVPGYCKVYEVCRMQSVGSILIYSTRLLPY